MLPRNEYNFHSVVVLMLTTTFAGCAAHQPVQNAARQQDEPRTVCVERGQANALVDGAGWIAGIPSKVALWDSRVDNHNVSVETEEQLVAYLDDQELESVLVRINQYDPLGEWRRLWANREIAFGWRYTVGTFNMLKYTLLVGRIFGEDWYNPYTNTINLYSDIPALALAEAAYAWDVHQREFPGAYAAIQEFPILGMWHGTIATRDVLEYVSRKGTLAEEQKAYRILYPEYGGNWGAGIGTFVPFGSSYGRLAGAAVGHAANGIRQIVATTYKSTTSPEESTASQSRGYESQAATPHHVE